MKDKTILAIVGIGAITILEVVNLLTRQIDGMILSSVVGAIVFIVTRKVYKPS